MGLIAKDSALRNGFFFYRYAALRAFQVQRARILVACMPKSGSTFLSGVIGSLPGFRNVRLVPEWGAREQELCEIQLARRYGRHYVAQNHVRYSGWTAHCLKIYGITPVVLIRDLFDVVPSLRDHWRRENYANPLTYEIPPDRDDASLERLAALCMSWYMNFYMSWRTAGHMIVRYEDMIARPQETVATILRAAGARVSSEAISQALETTKAQGRGVRLNVGVAGRGQTLPAETKSLVWHAVNCYPECHDDEYVRAMRAKHMG